jgi:hypothetical protein
LANSFSKVDWVAMKTLQLLVNKLTICSFMRTDYEKDFRKEFAVGDRVRVKLPWRPVVQSGFGWNPQNIERIETEVVVDQPISSQFEMDTLDILLNAERGEEKLEKEYLDPIATYMAAEWDKRAAEFVYKNTGNIVGVLGTNPSTFDSTSAAARQRLVELACPDSGKKGLFVPPAVMRSIKAGSGNMALFHPASEITKMFKKGVVGQADDFEWYESMSLKSHTAGTWAGAVTLSAAPANGAQSLSITCTTGDTFKEGDVIGLGAIYRVNPVTRERTESANTMTVTVAADATGAASAATVAIKEKLYFSGNYQNIDAQPANGATLTLFPGTTSPSAKAGKQGLAFHEDGFAFVNLPLPMPKRTSEELVTSATDPDTGTTISFIRHFDFETRKWQTRVDSLGGFGRLHAENCSVRILAA